MGITSSLQQFMRDAGAYSAAFSDFESTGTADIVCFEREIAALVESGRVVVEHNQDTVSRTWTVTKSEVTQQTPQPKGPSSLRDTDDRSKAVQKTPWRVSLDAMKRRVKSVEYVFPTSIPHMTIAVVMLDNGYALQGKSAPADPANFNKELGQQYAYEDAMRQLWALEAYVMRDYLSGDVVINNPNERWGD